MRHAKQSWSCHTSCGHTSSSVAKLTRSDNKILYELFGGVINQARINYVTSILGREAWLKEADSSDLSRQPTRRDGTADVNAYYFALTYFAPHLCRIADSAPTNNPKVN